MRHLNDYFTLQYLDSIKSYRLGFISMYFKMCENWSIAWNLFSNEIFL